MEPCFVEVFFKFKNLLVQHFPFLQFTKYVGVNQVDLLLLIKLALVELRVQLAQFLVL